MRILFSGECFYPPTSGGDLSVLTLFEELAKKNEVEAIFTGKKNEIDEYKGIKIYRVKSFASLLPSWVKRYFLNKVWFKVLDKHLKRYNRFISSNNAVMENSREKIAEIQEKWQ